LKPAGKPVLLPLNLPPWYSEVRMSYRGKGEKIILKRVTEITPLSEQDPIWQMVGLCQEDKDGVTDLADNHDRYLAEGETGSWEKPWRKV